MANRGAKVEQETEPDRLFRLKECTDMLIAAGYHRARIPSLVPFDKVVGGMVWAITASSIEVDIDLLYEENLTIRQRIKLAEQLVKALVSMRCPYPLQAQQIQGLDYDNLFPVIQWLVKEAIRTRTEQGDQNRALSVFQFQKSFDDVFDEHIREAAQRVVATVTEQYRPQRRFRKRRTAQFDDQYARTEATLLEYGEKIYRATRDEEKEGMFLLSGHGFVCDVPNHQISWPRKSLLALAELARLDVPISQPCLARKSPKNMIPPLLRRPKRRNGSLRRTSGSIRSGSSSPSSAGMCRRYLALLLASLLA